MIVPHIDYPFGLKQKGYNNVLNGEEYPYKYQGQERQNELGLNWDSYKWRNYDYAIGSHYFLKMLQKTNILFYNYENFKSNKSIQDILLLLTKEEAIELLDGLDKLINSEKKRNHVHINDFDFDKEITIAIYNDNNIEEFDERVQRLLLYDK